MTVLNHGIQAAKSDEELEGIKLGKDIPKLILNYYKNISQCNSNQYIARPTVRLENENKKNRMDTSHIRTQNPLFRGNNVA